MGASVADSGIPFLSTIEGEYQLNKEMAKAVENDAKFNAGQRRRQAERLMGEQIAAYGMSGVEASSGSPRDQIVQDFMDAEQEAMNIIYTGKLKSWDMKRRAQLAKQGAYEGLALKAGMMAASSGAFSGGGASGTTTMKDGGGFSSASTGTKGYTISESSSSYGLANKGVV